MKTEISRGSKVLYFLLFCMFVELAQFNIQGSYAQSTSTPGELPGWPVDLTGAGDFTFDIIVTDIDKDNKDEVIMGIDNEVHIIDKTGENLPGWPQQTSDRKWDDIFAIAVGDIDGDGNKEIVCTGDNGIYAWHWETGTLVDGWPLSINGDMVLGNFDDNPLDLEIAIAVVREYYSPQLKIYALNGDGTEINGWPRSFDVVQLYRVYLSTGNIDKVGSDEIVVACHRKSYYQSPIYVFHGDGQLASGWPIEGNGPFVSPAVLCNMDNNGDYEIVAATVNESHNGRIYAWKASGANINGWPSGYNAFHLAVGDLNSDDRPEIIASYSNYDYWGDHLAVINRHGTRLLSRTLELRTAATLGNADYDTDSEIIIPTWNGKLHVMDIDGQDLTGFPVYLGKGIMSRPSALGDLDGDGYIEIVQLDADEDKLHAFELKAPKATTPDWPMARHDEKRSSLWTPPRTAGFDILEITGSLEVLASSSTPYTAWAYFEDGSNRDVTLEANWQVDPCYADYAHFETGGVLVAHELSNFKDIIIYARYTENGFDEAASYEVRIRPTVQILYVDDDAANDPGPNDPSVSDQYESGTEEHPFDAIQEAIDVAGDGDTVIVLPGDYYENIDFMGKDFTLTSANPRDLTTVQATRIYSESGYAIIASDGDILGLSILGDGSGIGCGENVNYTCYSPTIRNCRIIVNGSGINFFVPYMHEAVYPVIENNIIAGYSCIYMFAQAFAKGGVEGIIRNNVLTNSRGDKTGYGIYYRTHKSTPQVINNIITKLKHGICLTYTSRLEERKERICYNNVYDNQENYHIDSPPTPLNLTGINGNISAQPFFVDYENDDFHLQSISPCVDAGDPNYVAGQNETDFDGEPRVMGGRVDIGADEFYRNTAPVACVVGGDRAVEADSNCEGRVVLDGSCSSDADSIPGTNDDINDFEWYLVDACDPNYEDYLGSGEVIECNLPLGENIIVLEVTDTAGAFDSNEVTITVEDVTGPEFSLVVEPNELWPPNHKMVLITVEWEVSDNCDDEPEVRLVSITSSEEDDGKGDGATSDDIVIGEDGSIYLRAESVGYLEGRVYTITYEAVDDSGNSTVQSATVTVPDGNRWRRRERITTIRRGNRRIRGRP